MGPQGTGGLCVRPGVEIRPFKVGGTGVQTYLPQQPREYPTRLEAGTLNGHGIAGLMAAMDYIRSVGRETIRSHELALARRFYEGAANTPGVTVYGDFSSSGPRADRDAQHPRLRLVAGERRARAGLRHRPRAPGRTAPRGCTGRSALWSAARYASASAG